jgi:exodeoxyribonuclease V alpha subunit
MPATTHDAVTLRGTIRRVFFAGPRFSAGKLESADGQLVSFAGKFFAREGDAVVLEGAWAQHPKYGRQFDAKSMTFDLAFSADGLANYLAKHPEIKGIGPAKARVIAERFGRDFAKALEVEPEAIAEVARVPLATILALHAEWTRTQALNDAMVHLSAYELSHLQVTRLVEKFGPSVVSVLETDPYVLIREVEGLGFRRVDKIARALGTPKELPGRIRAAILYVVEEALHSGHTWIDSEDLVDRANALLVMDTLDSLDRIDSTLNSLLDEGTLSVASCDERFRISDPEIRSQEEDLARILRQGARENPHFSRKDIYKGPLSTVLEWDHPELNDDQIRAIVCAASHSISVISGAAGSGKSFSVNILVNLYEGRGMKAVLAAPTGKAAKRLEEITGHSASTIHRLLGFDGRRFNRPTNRPINADVVIVDEVSLVDIPLAWNLFRVIDLERTAVVLVGDHNQLPPVGPGSLLRDLIATRAVPTTILRTVVRQAGVLRNNCLAVLAAEIRPTSEKEASGRRAWYVCDQFKEPLAAQRFVLRLFDEVLSERLGFDLLRDVQVLTPTHKGPLGTVEMNLAVRRLVQKKLWGVDAPETPPGRRPKFLLHDRVIQKRNNYDLGVMNGSIGRVTGVVRDGSLSVNFDGTVIDLAADSPDLDRLQLAYVLTTHSTQGSEFPCAIVIAHKAHSFMLHRNLLYTAVTRARASAILVGDRSGLSMAVRKTSQADRRTMLSYLLAVQPSDDSSSEEVHSPEQSHG